MNSTTQTIRAFRDYYVSTVRAALQATPAQDGLALIRQLRRALRRRHNTVFIFGNGGSSAIARHIGLNLEAAAKSVGHELRWTTGLETSLAQARSLAVSYDQIFFDQLMTARAGRRDLVILISGSGESANLIEALMYCRAQQVPVVVAAAFDGGRLARIGADVVLAAKVHDQQIGEDVIQALFEALLPLSIAPSVRISQVASVLRAAAADLETELYQFRPGLYQLAAARVVDAFKAGHQVFVLGPEGGGLGLVAEHTAHNLNWDAVYQVEQPPRRLIHSSPTVSDFSGIGNDRQLAVAPYLQFLHRANPGDVLLLFVSRPRSQAASHITVAAAKAGLAVAVVSVAKRPLAAAVAQMFGHSLCRLVRYRLKIDCDRTDIGEPFEFLKTNDMAQRRLLATTAGV